MDKQYLLNLTQKYFDGLTTSEEETLLARMITRTDDHDFDEVKAVMGFLCEGRSRRRSMARTIRLRSLIATAVAACISVVAITSMNHKEDEDLKLVTDTLSELFSNQGPDTDEVLQNLFNTL